jgi:hypothetical protein
MIRLRRWKTPIYNAGVFTIWETAQEEPSGLVQATGLMFEAWDLAYKLVIVKR